MMSEINQSMNETPINRVKRFLEIYRYTDKMEASCKILILIYLKVMD